jgi:histidyl-tRNA synthetase
MTSQDTQLQDELEQEQETGLRLLKGTDDHLPRQQIIRDRITDTLRSVFQLFGFNPCETPILNYFDILASKYAGGDEILKEVYQLGDQGNRTLALRYDLTVPFARLVGMNYEEETRLPFRRFEIGRVFRDGPVKKGRRREFYQCDVDMVGAPAPHAEAELIILADEAFRRLGLEVEVELNHRKVLSALVAKAGATPEQVNDVILSVDKLKKVGREGVAKELAEKGIDGSVAEKLFELLEIRADESNEACLERLRGELGEDESVKQALDELDAMFRVFNDAGVTLQVNFVPSLARGLDIYTGPVFEFFLKDRSLLDGAIAAGGRYDRIIRQFLEEAAERQGKKVLPELDFSAVGMSFGLEPLTYVMEQLAESANERRVVTQLYLIPLGTEVEAHGFAQQFRKLGINTEVEVRKVRMKKSLKRCNDLGIQFAGILGGDELQAGKIMLKDLDKGEQEQLSLEEAAARIKSAG